jgi:hypothetical protein
VCGCRVGQHWPVLLINSQHGLLFVQQLVGLYERRYVGAALAAGHLGRLLPLTFQGICARPFPRVACALLTRLPLLWGARLLPRLLEVHLTRYGEQQAQLQSYS